MNKALSLFQKPYALDQKCIELKEEDLKDWTNKPIWLSLLFIGLGIALTVSMMLLIHIIWPFRELTQFSLLEISACGTLCMSLGAWYVASPIAKRNGGWARTFGVTALSVKLTVLGIAGYFSFVVLNIIISLFFNAINPEATKEGSNVNTLSSAPAIVIATIFTTGILAPIIEEFVFRGVILRTLLRKHSFWVSATLSSLIFTTFHLIQVSTILGVLVLGITLFFLAMLLCILNRISDSIFPGIIVHALNNSNVLLISFYFTK